MSISNKRNGARPTNGKESVVPSSHSKENTNTKHSKVGLEILDFHESWLEEMELYKDKLYVQKHNLQLLGAHNHAHALQGCQMNSSTGGHDAVGKQKTQEKQMNGKRINKIES